jgi:hypothetical protein
MKLLGILFSCVCLQLASGPAARAYCPEGKAVQRDPGRATLTALPSLILDAAEPVVPGLFPLFVSLPALSDFPSVFASFGPKEYFIRTGLSPPLV